MTDPTTNLLASGVHPQAMAELYRINPSLRPSKHTSPVPDVPTGGTVPADLAPYFGKQPRDETVAVGRWATAHPQASEEELADAAWQIRLHLAVEARDKAERSHARRTALHVASLCGFCEQPNLRTRLANPGDRDLDGRPADPVFHPEASEYLDVPGQPRTVACMRCRPVILAAAAARYGAELVDGRPRAELVRTQLAALWVGPPVTDEAEGGTALVAPPLATASGGARRPRRLLG